jgi:hypothetical protein
VPFLRNVPGLEAVYRDYAKKGVQFFIVYKSVVHPGTNGVLDAVTERERILQLQLARERLGTTVPMVSDSLDGAIVRALQSAPNAEFVIDADGTVLSRKFWHDPAALRTFLAQRVGEVEPATRVEDLGMRLEWPERKAKTGLVPRKLVPPGMSIAVSQPVLPEDPRALRDMTPFFAKLLVEADQPLMEQGSGKLYLGFYLDPVYQVHWNNPAGGLSWQLAVVDDGGDQRFEPIRGTTPKFEHEIDLDPREFVLDVDLPTAKALQLTVTYTVCADDDSFCMPVTQQHRIELKPKPGGASRAGDWMTELVGDPMAHDADGDGRVTLAELPEQRARIILLHYDHNHDQAIDAREAALFYRMVRLRPGERTTTAAKASAPATATPKEPRRDGR